MSKATESVLAQLASSEVLLPEDLTRWMWAHAVHTQDAPLCVQLARRYPDQLGAGGQYPDVLPRRAVQELVASQHVPEAVALRWAVQSSWQEVCQFLRRPSVSFNAVKTCLSWARSSSYGVFVAVEVLNCQVDEELHVSACQSLVDVWQEDQGDPAQLRSSLRSLESTLERTLAGRESAWSKLLQTRPYPVIALSCLNAVPYPSSQLCEDLAAFAYTETAAAHSALVVTKLLNQPVLEYDTLGLIQEWVRMQRDLTEPALLQELDRHLSQAHLPRNVKQWSADQVEEFLSTPGLTPAAVPPVLTHAATSGMSCGYESTWDLEESGYDWACRQLQAVSVLSLAKWLYRRPASKLRTTMYTLSSSRCTVKSWEEWCSSPYVNEDLLSTERFRSHPAGISGMSMNLLRSAGCVDLVTPYLDQHLTASQLGTAVRMASTWAGTPSELVNTALSIHAPATRSIENPRF